MEEKSTFQKDLEASTVLEKKLNRKELRKIYGGAKAGHRSMAPRNIASRKILPMPVNWKGWRDWKPKNKKVS